MSEQNPLPHGHDEIVFIPRISVQAFCESPEFASVMQNASGDRRLDKVQLRVQMGGIEAAIEAYREAPTPNLIMVETGTRAADILNRLEELAQYCDEGTKVMVSGRTNDVMLYRELINRGISDYLVLPISPIDIVKAISKAYQTNEKPLGKIIAFMGAKGGAGSSSIAHGVGFAMSRELAKNTAIIDFDLAFGTAALNFNQDGSTSLSEAAQTPERIDAALIDRSLTRLNDRLSLLGTSALLDRTVDLTVDSVDYLYDALRQTVPISVIDMPHQWNSAARKALVQADIICLVATPDLANLRNLKNMYDNLRAARPNDLAPYYLLNQIGVPKRPEIKITDFTRAIEAEPISMLEFDPQSFGAAANNGQMIAEMDPNNPLVNHFIEIAQILIRQKEIQRAKPKSVLTQLSPLLEKLSSFRKKAS